MKIELERIDMQERIIVEALLDSSTIRLAMSLEFVRKQEFKLKKMEKPIDVRNVDCSFNKEGPIKHMVEITPILSFSLTTIWRGSTNLKLKEYIV